MTSEEYQELMGKIEAARTNSYSFSSAPYTAGWDIPGKLSETLRSNPRLKDKSPSEIQAYESALAAMMAVSYSPIAQLFDEMRAKVQDECVSFASGDDSPYAEGMMPIEYSTGALRGSIRSGFNPANLSFYVRAESDHYKWVHLGSPSSWTEGAAKSKYIAFYPMNGDTRDQGKTGPKTRKPSSNPEHAGKIVIKLSGPVLEKLESTRQMKGPRPFLPVIMAGVIAEYDPEGGGPNSHRLAEAVIMTVDNFLRVVSQQ